MKTIIEVADKKFAFSDDALAALNAVLQRDDVITMKYDHKLECEIEDLTDKKKTLQAKHVSQWVKA